jgi:hypothetical protein
MGEDLLFIRQARKWGTFFYVPTRTVYTSTRRFDRVGYWKLFLQWWAFVAVLPKRRQEALGYKAIR